MELEPAALWIVGTFTAASLAVSGITMALGALAAALPRRAAEIWASERLRNMSADRQASLVRWFRVFGIFLFLTGAVYGFHSLTSPQQ